MVSGFVILPRLASLVSGSGFGIFESVIKEVEEATRLQTLTRGTQPEETQLLRSSLRTRTLH
jgi:hypothetical protein